MIAFSAIASPIISATPSSIHCRCCMQYPRLQIPSPSRSTGYDIIYPPTESHGHKPYISSTKLHLHQTPPKRLNKPSSTTTIIASPAPTNHHQVDLLSLLPSTEDRLRNRTPTGQPLTPTQMYHVLDLTPGYLVCLSRRIERRIDSEISLWLDPSACDDMLILEIYMRFVIRTFYLSEV